MVGIAYVLWYLYAATKAASRELPAFTRSLAIIGPLLMGVSSILVPVFRYLACQSFLDGTDTSATPSTRRSAAGACLPRRWRASWAS